MAYGDFSCPVEALIKKLGESEPSIMSVLGFNSLEEFIRVTLQVQLKDEVAYLYQSIFDGSAEALVIKIDFDGEIEFVHIDTKEYEEEGYADCEWADAFTLLKTSDVKKTLKVEEPLPDEAEKYLGCETIILFIERIIKEMDFGEAETFFEQPY